MNKYGYSKSTYSGFTLVELLVALVILGIVAKVTIPMLSPADEEKLDVVVTEVAGAIRYARAESVRRGGPPLTVGFTLNSTTGVVALNYYSLQIVGLNLKATINTSTDVINPIDKKPYSINTKNLAFASGATLGTVTYANIAQPGPVEILFNSSGVPSNALAPSYQLWPLFSTQLPVLIPVQLGKQSKNIQIDATGRVSVL